MKNGCYLYIYKQLISQSGPEPKGRYFIHPRLHTSGKEPIPETTKVKLIAPLDSIRGLFSNISLPLRQTLKQAMLQTVTFTLPLIRISIS